MHRFAALALLATALPLATVPAAAAPMRSDTVAQMMRATHFACQSDLRGSTCASRQQRLLNAVVVDARSTNNGIAGSRVANRQLDMLIASIR